MLYVCYISICVCHQVPTVHTVCVDLGDWDKARAAVSTIGPIDLLVNNAAMINVSSCLETPPEDFDA